MRKGISISEQKQLVKEIRKLSRRHAWYIGLLIVANILLATLVILKPARSIQINGVALIETSRGTGSGFIVNEEGNILTAAHVIEGENQVGVILRDGTYLEAKVVFTDPSVDIGLLKLIQSQNIPKPLRLGDLDLINETDEVYVVGYPGSEYSITDGIIAQKTQNYLKTNAESNPGNSGGPLITKGDNLVIGVVVSTKIIAGERAEGQHYAVPINIVDHICQDHGHPIR